MEYQKIAINSLAEMVLQNRWALDILTTETGGTGTLLKESCCFYINTSGQVVNDLEIIKQNIKIIAQTEPWP